MAKWWMVRAGDDNELIPEWVNKGVASIGWEKIGNLIKYSTRDELIKKCDQVFDEAKPGSRIAWGSQLWRFSHEISVNDRVITYDKSTREYLIGKVIKTYEFNQSIISDYYPNVIGVSWETKRVSRDTLSQGAKNSLGGVATVFRIDQWGAEVESLLTGVSAPTEIQTYDSEEFKQQILSMIEDLVSKLDPWQMQELVAGLLRAMGYQVKVSPKGPDGGVDLLAHKDAFGFEKPIIKVQVKHRISAASAPDIQQLLGANPIGASCLFVSTGGFTSSAQKTASQNNVTLIDLDSLVKYVTEWYDNFPAESKSLIPLQKVYIPF